MPRPIVKVPTRGQPTYAEAEALLTCDRSSAHTTDAVTCVIRGLTKAHGDGAGENIGGEEQDRGHGRENDLHDVWCRNAGFGVW